MKNKYIIVSFSGGKDSTAMLLHMIELQEHIDEVICCDTYKEFPAMYNHIDKVQKIVEDNGIKFTMLRHPRSFDEWMFEYEPKRRNPEQFKAKYGDAKGKSWPTPKSRWCTGELKIKIIDAYVQNLTNKYDLVKVLGIAADEEDRLQRKNQQQNNCRFPLVEWGWTEKDCLKYCYDKGYDWDGLYEIFDRVSCWCCPLQPLESLRKLRTHFPDLWQQLKEMDKKTWQKFKEDYSVEELDIRFAFEEERLARGLSIRNKEFFTQLRQILSAQNDMDLLSNKMQQALDDKMTEYIVVSFSGGKDSTAMLLRLLELNESIDEVVHCITGKEFPAMQEHIVKIQNLVESKGIKFTILENEKTFDELMFDHEPKRRKQEALQEKHGDSLRGYSWPDSRCRWCTKALKTNVIKQYLQTLSQRYALVQYVGIAADETQRVKPEEQENKRYPLIEWGWTEKDCLEYCLQEGYDWGGLYDHFNRASCWCCPLKSLDELRQLRKYYPDLWEKLRDMDRRTWRQFRSDYSIDDLDIRFDFEEKRIEENLSIRSRDFFAQLKQLLNQ